MGWKFPEIPRPRPMVHLHYLEHFGASVYIFNFFFNADFILVRFVAIYQFEICMWELHDLLLLSVLTIFYFNFIICMYFQRYPTDRAYFIAKEILMTERTYKKDLEILNLVSHFLHYYIN